MTEHIEDSETINKALRILRSRGFNYFVMSLKENSEDVFLLYLPFEKVIFLDREKIELEVPTGERIIRKTDDIVRIEILKAKNPEFFASLEEE